MVNTVALILTRKEPNCANLSAYLNWKSEWPYVPSHDGSVMYTWLISLEPLVGLGSRFTVVTIAYTLYLSDFWSETHSFNREYVYLSYSCTSTLSVVMVLLLNCAISGNVNSFIRSFSTTFFDRFIGGSSWIWFAWTSWSLATGSNTSGCSSAMML